MTTTKIFACLFIPLIMDVLPSCGIAIAGKHFAGQEPENIKATTKSAPLLTLHAQTATLGPIAFSPDGQYLAAGSYDGTVVLWNARTGREEHTFRAHHREIWSVAFSPDGKCLVTASACERAKIWDTASTRNVRTLTWQDAVIVQAVFSPDGRQLATPSCVMRRVGREITIDGFGSVITEKQKWVYRVKLWEVGKGRATVTLRAGSESVKTGRHKIVCSVAYSHDSRRLAWGGPDGKILIWDLASRKELFAFRGHKGVICVLAFSSDGRLLTSAGADGKAKVWALGSLIKIARKPAADGREPDLSEDPCILKLKAHRDAVMSVAWSPDGKYLASVCVAPGDQGDTLGDVSLWDSNTGKELVNLGSGKYGHPGTGGVAFSPDGKRLATAHTNGTVKIWELAELLGQKRSK